MMQRSSTQLDVITCNCDRAENMQYLHVFVLVHSIENEPTTRMMLVTTPRGTHQNR